MCLGNVAKLSTFQYFEKREATSQLFNEDFIRDYNELSDPKALFPDFIPINFRVIIFSDLKTLLVPCLVCNFYT